MKYLILIKEMVQHFRKYLYLIRFSFFQEMRNVMSFSWAFISAL